MKTILLTNKYGNAPYEILKSVVADDFNLLMLDEVTQENLQEKIKDADYLLVSGRLKLGRAELENAKSLKMIQRTGVGLDSLDLDCIKEMGLPLYVNKGVNAGSVAEHAVMMMLSLLRMTAKVNTNVRNGIWKKQETGLQTHELCGRTVGIIGMGNIGKAVVRMLSGFQVKILYYDAYRLSQEQESELGVEYCSMEELLKTSDIVSLHCSYQEEIGSIIREKELAMMKEDSILVNTSRGKLIDEASLVKALENGKFMGVGLDVFEKEPVAKDNPLFAFDNVIVSPHIGGVTYEAFRRMMKDAVDNMRCFERGELEQIEKSRLI